LAWREALVVLNTEVDVVDIGGQPPIDTLEKVVLHSVF
jgi:hypothetical protein